MTKALIASLIKPNWPAPSNVLAIQTTRIGGVSAYPYDSFNLGDHVNDKPFDVAHNRQLLSSIVPSEPVWLKQEHGIKVVDAALSSCLALADASFTTREHVVCAIMTADCLPILLCDKAGTVVASVHAGWRSLCGGIIEQTVKSMPVAASDIIAWLGPAIGPQAFEVGAEVREQFVKQDAHAEQAFKADGNKWLGDLYCIAKRRLQLLGVFSVYGEIDCTFSNPQKYFSYRRDGNTGRMATMIWLSA